MPNRTCTVGEAFELAGRGSSRYTKTYMREHPGDYPVYSASTIGPVGSVDSFDFDGDFLSFSTNGYAGRMMIVRGQFASTSDRAFLTPTLDGLDLEYCRAVLEPRMIEAARGRRQDGKRRNEYTKLPPDEAMAIEFELPVDGEGEPDVAAQRSYVARWDRAFTLQQQAKELARLIESAVVLPTLPESMAVREVRLTDASVFRFLKSETGWFKRNWFPLNTGDPNDIPVYSAAREAVAHVTVAHPKLITASPESLVLSFAVDGDGSAGTNFVLHDRPFYISTNRAALVAESKRVDLTYVYFALQSMKADYGFGYNYKAYPARLGDVVVSLPVDDDGDFDLAAQADAADRMEGLRELRSKSSQVLRTIEEAQVRFEATS